MIAERLLWSASQNLVGTYLLLGQASHGSKVWQEGAFQACVGPLDHPICNFATDLKAESGVGDRLRRVALGRRCFSVYSLPTDAPAICELLAASGFHQSHAMAQFVRDGEVAGPEGPELVPAGTEAERRVVAGFMADQFFSKQAGRFKKGILEATVRAQDLTLCHVDWNGSMAGAVMLFQHNGTIGIYNLCVQAGLRGRGLGSDIIQSVCRLAGRQGATLVLQSDPTLASWYRSLGFAQAGTVQVFTLPKFNRVDIMDA